MIGYHVTQPCQPCMDACNNGHFWMFHVDHVVSTDRKTPYSNPTHAFIILGAKPMVWANLPRPDKDMVDADDSSCR